MERKVAREFRHKVRFKHHSHLCEKRFALPVSSVSQVYPLYGCNAVGLTDSLTKNEIATKA